ncbi:NADH-quinone oxidoreductase subunit D, partial [Planococcus sp. SIMBA_143]
LEKAREFVPYMREQLAGYHDLVTGNEIFMARMKGVGAYSKQKALAYSLSGANLRCTGVQWDLRKNEPYSLYDRFQFEVPVFPQGDA